MKFSLLTVVLLLSAVMLTTIDGSQNSVQAQNITSTLLPSTLPPQDGTSVPTTPAQASSDGEDASSSSSDSVSDDASESGDVSDLQEDASSGVGSNSVPITPSKSSDNNDESSSNSGNDESSGSSEIGEGRIIMIMIMMITTILAHKTHYQMKIMTVTQKAMCHRVIKKPMKLMMYSQMEKRNMEKVK